MAPALPRWASAPLWAGARHVPALPSLSEAASRRWDAVVVGGGLTGLLTATLLHRGGADVLVLERHDIGGVTTVGSTGKLTALQGNRTSTIAGLRGSETAATYATAAAYGVAGLRSLIDELSIECALTAAPDTTFATEAAGARRCAEEMTAAQAAGLPVRWIDDLELPFPTLGGVRLDDQAHLDPGALCAGLAAALPPGRTLEGCPVHSVTEGDDGVEVALAGEIRIRADHVVIATLGPVHDPSLLATRCAAARSYAVAAPHAAPPAGTYISLDEAPRSIRPALVGGRPGVVVAGEGHQVGEDGGRAAAERWARLEAYCVDALGADGALHRWQAHDLVPSDGVPLIGRVARGTDRRWVATGFQKWGISTAYVAADLIRAEIDAAPREWSAVFDPRRLCSVLTTDMAKTAARSLRHLVGDRLRDVVRRDRHPTCTHLGCVLAFDEAERSWDCPCHGSRYEEDGAVICGPAVRPLTAGSPDDRA